MALDNKTISSLLDAHLAVANNEHETWDEYRRLWTCNNWGDDPYGRTGRDDDLITESGSMYAYTDTMIASVVPPNPQITANPRRDGLEEPARYREALINFELKRLKAHRILWKLSTHSSIYPRGVIKAVWNDTQNRPDILNIDPRTFFYDLSAQRWQDIRYCIQATVITKAEFAERVKEKNRAGARVYDPVVAAKAQPGSYPTWLLDTSAGKSDVPERLKKAFEWVSVFEFFDFTVPGGAYHHILKGQEKPLFSDTVPYAFLRNPFHVQMFNDNLEDIGGMADASIVQGPIRRKDELLSLKLRFAQATIPVTVVDERKLDDVEGSEDQLENATSPGDIVRLKIKSGSTINDVLSQTPTAQLSPAFGEIERSLENEINFRLGMPAYQRGEAGSSDLATEVALMDMALRTRQGKRSEIVNDTIQFMAGAIMALYEEFMSPDSDLPIRIGKGEFLAINKQHLQSRDPAKADAAAKRGEPVEASLEIDYDVIPYSPTENSKVAKIKKLREFYAPLLELGASPKKLLEVLGDLLELGDMSKTPEELQEEQAAMAAEAGLPPPGDPALGETEQAIPVGGAVPSIPVGPNIAQGPMVGGAGHPMPES